MFSTEQARTDFPAPTQTSWPKSHNHFAGPSADTILLGRRLASKSTGHAVAPEEMCLLQRAGFRGRSKDLTGRRLLINPTSAKKLGIDVPLSVMGQAGRLVE